MQTAKITVQKFTIFSNQTTPIDLMCLLESVNYLLNKRCGHFLAYFVLFLLFNSVLTKQFCNEIYILGLKKSLKGRLIYLKFINSHNIT